MSGDVRLTVDTQRGATISAAYAGREVKAYAVLEHEIDAISRLNAQATVYFSLAASVASVPVGIWVNAAFSEKLTPEGHILAMFAAPLLCVLSVVFVGLGWSAIRSKRSMWDAVRRESQSPPTA